MNSNLMGRCAATATSYKGVWQGHGDRGTACRAPAFLINDYQFFILFFQQSPAAGAGCGVESRFAGLLCAPRIPAAVLRPLFFFYQSRTAAQRRSARRIADY